MYNSKETSIYCCWSFVFIADYWTIFHMINEQVVLIVRCFDNISFRSHKNHSTIAISTPIVRQISTHNFSQGVSNQAIETIEPYLVQSVLLAQSEHFIPPSNLHNQLICLKQKNNTISQWFMNLPNWQSIAVIKMLATMVAHSITRETANACARAQFRRQPTATSRLEINSPRSRKTLLNRQLLPLYNWQLNDAVETYSESR